MPNTFLANGIVGILMRYVLFILSPLSEYYYLHGHRYPCMMTCWLALTFLHLKMDTISFYLSGFWFSFSCYCCAKDCYFSRWLNCIHRYIREVYVCMLYLEHASLIHWLFYSKKVACYQLRTWRNRRWCVAVVKKNFKF